MTSASELFYTRRSRLGRTNTDLGLDSSPELNYHQNSRRQNYHNRRNDLDGCDPLRRSAHLRPCLRLSHSDREPVRFNQGPSQHISGNHIITESSSSMSNRPRVTRSERLPGAVLMARERLLERLRGVSVPERRSSRNQFHIYHNNNAVTNDFRLPEAGDWETELLSGFSPRGALSLDLTSENDQLAFSSKPGKKPPGLTQDAINCLHMEVFSARKSDAQPIDSTGTRDCSICLDIFMDEDMLVRLPCNHRFHFACLDPWVRTCGDCPYCRQPIL